MIGGLLGVVIASSRPALVELLGFPTVGALEISPTDASAEFRINPNGDLEKRVDGGAFVKINTWLLSGIAADFDVKLTVTGGALTTGSESQLNCGSIQTWTVVETTNGVAESSADFTLELFAVGGSVPLDTLTGRRLQANVEL